MTKKSYCLGYGFIRRRMAKVRLLGLSTNRPRGAYTFWKCLVYGPIYKELNYWFIIHREGFRLIRKRKIDEIS